MWPLFKKNTIEECHVPRARAAASEPQAGAVAPGGTSRLAAAQSQWNPTNTARTPYENRWRNAKTVKTCYLKKRKNLSFFENTVFTVFACLQQSSCGFRMVFVRFSSAFVNAVATSFCFATLRYALHAACARLLFFFSKQAQAV